MQGGWQKGEKGGKGGKGGKGEKGEKGEVRERASRTEEKGEHIEIADERRVSFSKERSKHCAQLLRIKSGEKKRDRKSKSPQ